jgi:hypothetical protein
MKAAGCHVFGNLLKRHVSKRNATPNFSSTIARMTALF